MFDEEEIQRKELQRLLSSATGESRKSVIQRSMLDLDNRYTSHMGQGNLLQQASSSNLISPSASSGSSFGFAGTAERGDGLGGLAADGSSSTGGVGRIQQSFSYDKIGPGSSKGWQNQGQQHFAAQEKGQGGGAGSPNGQFKDSFAKDSGGGGSGVSSPSGGGGGGSFPIGDVAMHPALLNPHLQSALSRGEKATDEVDIAAPHSKDKDVLGMGSIASPKHSSSSGSSHNGANGHATLASSGSASNLGAPVKTLSRPSSASTAGRQRRPSFTLDAIPEGANEHRPNSKYKGSAAMTAAGAASSHANAGAAGSSGHSSSGGSTGSGSNSTREGSPTGEQVTTPTGSHSLQPHHASSLVSSTTVATPSASPVVPSSVRKAPRSSAHESGDGSKGSGSSSGNSSNVSSRAVAAGAHLQRQQQQQQQQQQSMLNINGFCDLAAAASASVRPGSFPSSSSAQSAFTGNTGGYSGPADVTDIVASSHVDVQRALHFCTRIESSSPLGLLYHDHGGMGMGVGSPPLIGTGSSGGPEPDHDKRKTVLNWICTGSAPQVLFLTLSRVFQVHRVVIECFGCVEAVTVKLMHLSEGGSLSGTVPVLLTPPGAVACEKVYDASANNNSFMLNFANLKPTAAAGGGGLGSSRGVTGRGPGFTSGAGGSGSGEFFCNQLGVTIEAASDIFYGITSIQIYAS